VLIILHCYNGARYTAKVLILVFNIYDWEIIIDQLLELKNNVQIKMSSDQKSSDQKSSDQMNSDQMSSDQRMSSDPWSILARN
jgi:hypothetical protein